MSLTYNKTSRDIQGVGDNQPYIPTSYKNLRGKQSYSADFGAARFPETSKHTLPILSTVLFRIQNNRNLWVCGGVTCGSGRGMDSGELAQDFCLGASPCLSLCRCLNLLHPPNLHESALFGQACSEHHAWHK